MNYCDNKAAVFLTNYSQQVAKDLMETDFHVLARIAGLILATKQSGKRVYTAGNGGSAATASHMANDLMKGARVFGRVGFRTICLNDSTPILTCLANDFSYEDVYSIQLQTYAEPGDLLIVFSGSGNSPNIVKALQTAREMGLTTIGFGGCDGGKMKDFCDVILIAPTGCMEQLEDMHMLYEHAITSLMQEVLSRNFDVEVVNYPKAGHKFKAAFFDFDGTGAALVAPGCSDFLKLLKSNGVALCLAGGAEEARLKSECDRLGLSEYFDQGIYGAHEDGTPCQKDDVIRRLLEENGWSGKELVAFGDEGFDVKTIKEFGGYAVGLATNEMGPAKVNKEKQSVLHDAGADAIVPDFSDPERLWRFLNR
jgi:D-sedoheptulose 7-phosphate isomerase